MKAPDKVFFPNDINLLTKLSLVLKQKDDVCYIRKDALIEWLQPRANELKQRWMANPADEEAFHKQIVFSSIIDKLNSM